MNTHNIPTELRWQERLKRFIQALSALERAIEKANSNSNDFTELERDGTIQRFEFTVELAWKVLQDLLEARGYAEVKGPRNVLKQAFQDGYISEGHSWMQMLESRNESVHLYDEERSVVIFENIQMLYCKLLSDLRERLLKEVLK